MNYRVTPLLLGDAVVPDVLDVFWSLTKARGASSVADPRLPHSRERRTARC